MWFCWEHGRASLTRRDFSSKLRFLGLPILFVSTGTILNRARKMELPLLITFVRLSLYLS